MYLYSLGHNGLYFSITILCFLSLKHFKIPKYNSPVYCNDHWSFDHIKLFFYSKEPLTCLDTVYTKVNENLGIVYT
jgi:hypothetical protein